MTLFLAALGTLIALGLFLWLDYRSVCKRWDSREGQR